eukprot:g2356.t1
MLTVKRKELLMRKADKGIFEKTLLSLGFKWAATLKKRQTIKSQIAHIVGKRANWSRDIGWESQQIALLKSQLKNDPAAHLDPQVVKRVLDSLRSGRHTHRLEAAEKAARKAKERARKGSAGVTLEELEAAEEKRQRAAERRGGGGVAGGAPKRRRRR